MIQRRLDWRSRLVEWGLGLRGKPFAWGKTDCATLGREALALCFGRDVAPQTGTPWDTARKAALRLRRFPYHEQLERVGAARTSLPFVRAGDIVIADEPAEGIGQMSILVCLDATSFLGSSSEDGVQIVGLENVPADAVVYSLWEIPGEEVADGEGR